MTFDLRLYCGIRCGRDRIRRGRSKASYTARHDMRVHKRAGQHLGDAWHWLRSSINGTVGAKRNRRDPKERTSSSRKRSQSAPQPSSLTAQRQELARSDGSRPGKSQGTSQHKLSSSDKPVSQHDVHDRTVRMLPIELTQPGAPSAGPVQGVSSMRSQQSMSAERMASIPNAADSVTQSNGVYKMGSVNHEKRAPSSGVAPHEVCREQSAPEGSETVLQKWLRGMSKVGLKPKPVAAVSQTNARPACTAGPLLQLVNSVAEAPFDLLSESFAGYAQEAIHVQRKLFRNIRQIKIQQKAASDLQSKLNDEIIDHRLEHAELVQDAQEALTAEIVQKITKEEQQLEKLNLLLREAVAEQRYCQACLIEQYEAFIDIQKDSNKILESTFVNAGIVSPETEVPDAPSTSREVEQESRGLHALMHGDPLEISAMQPAGFVGFELVDALSSTPGGTPASQNGIQHQPAPISRDQNHRLDDAARAAVGLSAKSEHLVQAYATAKHQLRKAQMEFDAREKTRDREQLLNNQWRKQSNGTRGFSKEDFDVRWVRHNMKLTGRLIEKENEFKKAKAAALEGGWDLDDPDASSGFDNVHDDGYPHDVKITCRSETPVSEIEVWRGSIDPGRKPPEHHTAPDLDPWTSFGKLAPEDSSSEVAEPKLKAKILGWQRKAAAQGKARVSYTTNKESSEFAGRDSTSRT